MYIWTYLYKRTCI